MPFCAGKMKYHGGNRMLHGDPHSLGGLYQGIEAIRRCLSGQYENIQCRWPAYLKTKVCASWIIRKFCNLVELIFYQCIFPIFIKYHIHLPAKESCSCFFIFLLSALSIKLIKFLLIHY
jgi:hypothetical protein